MIFIRICAEHEKTVYIPVCWYKAAGLCLWSPNNFCVDKLGNRINGSKMSNGTNSFKMSQSQPLQNVTLSVLNSMCAAVSCWDGCPTWCWWQRTACIPSCPWTTSPCLLMQGEYPQRHPTWMGKQPPSLSGLSMEHWGSGYCAPLMSMWTSETLTRYTCSTWLHLVFI